MFGENVHVEKPELHDPHCISSPIIFIPMNDGSPKTFQVYSASAGAGKTFNLVKEFLCHCLRDSDTRRFSQILAITFTVKAAGEMKSRVLAALDGFRQNPRPSEHDAMFAEVQDELKMDETTLRNRSNDVLRKMLHDYTSLGISTIDKFTYRLVRTFGHELGLSSSFDLNLDEQELFRESIDILLDETGQNSKVTTFFQGFIEHHMDEGKNWRPELKMLEMAKHLSKEESYEIVERLSKIDLEGFSEIRKRLRARLNELLKRHRQLVAEGKNLFGDIEPTYFSSSYLPKYLKHLESSDSLKWMPGKSIFNQLEAGRFTVAKPKPEAEAAVGPITDDLMEWVQKCIDFASTVGVEVYMLRAIMLGFDSAAVLHEISWTLQEYKDANNVETLATFNKLIHDSLQNLPAPYIYERIGEKYRHYFIDEFQDTSLLQWSNLTPLVHNSIASGGTAMIVGDAKQSIYRWRGGKPDQFLNLIAQAKHPEESGNDMAYALKYHNLQSNWRSRKKIVEFNNDLFSGLGENFNFPSYRELYEEAVQEPKGGDGGYIHLSFVESSPAEVYQRETLQLIVDQINECKNDGYRLGDIAILVRQNKMARLTASFLAKEGIDVVSQDSLLLQNSTAVRLIVACIRYLHYPNDTENRMEMVDMLFQLGRIENSSEALHKSLMIAGSDDEFAWQALLENCGIDLGNAWVGASGLYEKGESLARNLKLLEKADPFVQFFLDELYEFGVSKGQGIHDFLEWWEEKKDKLSISSPQTRDSVQIMTIHKAKGLEFPVVIFPFASFETAPRNDTKRWIPFEEDQFEGLPAIEMSFKKEAVERLSERYPRYAEAYEQVVRETVFDAVNMMYVAMTRPIDRLYVMTKGDDSQRKDHIGRFLWSFVQKHEKSSSSGSTAIFGEKTAPKEEKKGSSSGVKVFTSFYSAEWRHRVKLSRDTDGLHDQLSDRPRAWGNLVHEMMARIQTVGDIDAVIHQFVAERKLTKASAQPLKERIIALVSHPQIADAFNADEVLNERDWLGDDRSIRPDRMARKGDRWFVIDYKTGEVVNSHKKQIREYAELLDSDNVQAFLVYINDELEVVPVDLNSRETTENQQISLF